MEIWKDIPEYEGYYQVSNLGRVKSVDRVVVNNNFKGLGYSKTRSLKGKPVSAFNTNGYVCVKLYKEGKKRQYALHQLLAMAFLGHKPNNHEQVVDHKDNNKLNNDLSNLQIVSQRDNVIKSLKQLKGYHATKNREGRVVGYQATIWLNGKSNNIGYYQTEEDANKAYLTKLNEIK